MTGRERMIAAVRGGEVDRVPVLAVGSVCEGCDGVVVDSPERPEGSEPLAVLVRVPNPFGLARSEGVDLNAELSCDPEAGEGLHAAYRDRVQASIEAALGAGADGIFYQLGGACPAESTPMQYGGYHLEHDRAILEACSQATLNAIFVEGDEPYLDFVSDLPAHAFGWDSRRNTTPLAEVRDMRQGALMLDDPAADIRIQVLAGATLECAGRP